MRQLILAMLVLALLMACTSQRPETKLAKPIEIVHSDDVLGVRDDKHSRTHDAASLARNYHDYTDALFAQAMNDGTLVFIEFTSSDCAQCDQVDMIVTSVFDDFAAERVDVVGLRIDYDRRSDLRLKYGIFDTPAHLIVKDDRVIWRNLRSDITQQQLKDDIMQFVAGVQSSARTDDLGAIKQPSSTVV